ncbi:MAG TPA: hypothetical protein VH280_21070 [Verrucomicrobiae bacterium]|jgi:hypothetical protein|nr:hypothetical protein [Verrucomicrobiae bacterium]
MKQSQILIIAAASFLSHAALAVPYLTEATITPMPDNGQYQVDVRVSRLIQQDGKQVEELVARPRILSGLGCPAEFYQGPQPANPDYRNKDNVSVDVSWPYPKESGLAFCTVIVKHGDKMVSESKFQLKITGPGRAPLVLSPRNVDGKSVRVVTDKPRFRSYVLLEFDGKTQEEAKAMAIENLGNKVQIQDASGHVVGDGVITGTYKDIGLALSYNSEDEAKQVASALEETK